MEYDALGFPKISIEDFEKIKPRYPVYTLDAYKRHISPDPTMDQVVKHIDERMNEDFESEKIKSHAGAIGLVSPEERIAEVQKDSDDDFFKMIKNFPLTEEQGKEEAEKAVGLKEGKSWIPKMTFDEAIDVANKGPILGSLAIFKKNLKNLSTGVLKTVLSEPEKIYNLVRNQAERLRAEPDKIKFSDFLLNPTGPAIPYFARVISKEITDRTKIDDRIIAWSDKKIRTAAKILKPKALSPRMTAI